MQFILHPSVSILWLRMRLGLLGRNYAGVVWIRLIVLSISVIYIHCTAACLLREIDGPCVMYVCTRFYAPRKDHTLRTSASVDIRELKQTTTMKATRTSLNKSFNELSKTVAVHVRYKSSYISMPSSAKQQREITKFCVVYGTGTTTANFSYFYLNLNAVVSNLA